MLDILRHQQSNALLSSKLYDQDSFYPAFLKDLRSCHHELIIESPFITTKRTNALLPYLRSLQDRGVAIVINTKDPREHDLHMEAEARLSIGLLQTVGAQILYTGGHHRKLAIIDRHILYEGSLNLLSQNDSCEVMRRIESEEIAQQMIKFTRLNRFL